MSAFLLRPIPLAPAAVTGNVQRADAPASNLASPQPKEVWQIPNSPAAWTRSLLIDLQGAFSIDTIALLSHNGTAGGVWSAWGRTDAQGPFPGFFNTAGAHLFFFRDPWRVAPAIPATRFHALHTAAAPVAVRYLCIQPESLDASNPDWFGGVLAVGWRIQPEFSLDWGGGRRVEDLSTVRVLDDGARGVWRKARVPEIRGSFSHLSEAELTRVWGVLTEAGESGPLLLVEDGAATAGQQERIHYGTLTGLDFYERRQTEKSRIEFRLTHWL